MKPGEYILAAQDRPRHPWWHPLAEPQPKSKRPKGKKVPNKVQVLVFKRKSFNKTASKAWAKKHGFKSSKCEETASGYRIEQRLRSAFKPGSLKYVELTEGVKARIGTLR